MRTPAEIKFRLRQETANIYLAIAKPRFTGELTPTPLPLPDPRPAPPPSAVRSFEFTVLATAQSILAHRFPLLGTTLETGPNIEWRRDYAHKKISAGQIFPPRPLSQFRSGRRS